MVTTDNCSFSYLDESCTCLAEPQACAYGPNSCAGQSLSEEKGVSLLQNDLSEEDENSRNILGWLLRKRKNHIMKRTENENLVKPKMKNEP